jgi:ribosomal protein L35
MGMVKVQWSCRSHLITSKSKNARRGFMNNLIRYSMQIAMLKQLLARKLISEKEYTLVKQKLMKDYKVLSDITA